MPARHKLATSRLSWLAIIPTCLAKIGIVVPARGGCGLGGYFASKARHGGSRCGYRQSAAHGRLQFLEFGQRRHERQHRRRDQLGHLDGLASTLAVLTREESR